MNRGRDKGRQRGKGSGHGGEGCIKISKKIG
jgi:hypothetical protein